MFVQEKKQISDQLEFYSNKLLFPLTFINSVEVNGLSTLSTLFTNYNSFIKKFRNLKNKLKNLTSWGLLYDSHYLWKSTVLTNVVKIKACANEIINYIDGIDIDPIKKIIMDQNNIKGINIVTFMLIQRSNNEYTLLNKRIIIDEIKILIPRCLMPVNTKNLKIELENIHELDPSDILVEFNHQWYN